MDLSDFTVINKTEAIIDNWESVENEREEIIITVDDEGHVIVVSSNKRSINEHNNNEYETTEEDIMEDWGYVQEESVIADEHQDEVQSRESLSTMDNEDDVAMIPALQDEYLTSRPFPCDFCSRRFRKKANLINHMVAHRHDRPHVCNICGCRYGQKCDLMNHLKVHAYIDDNFVGSQFMGKDYLRIREDEDETDDDNNDDLYPVDNDKKLKLVEKETKNNDKKSRAAVKIFPCQHCGAIFQKKYLFDKHDCTSDKEKDGNLNCKFCSELFSDFEMLKKHYQNEHRKSVMRTGDISSVSYLNDEEHSVTDVYMTDIQNVEYVCNFCDATFANLEMLKNHRMKHVSDVVIEDHICDECDDECSNSLDLLTHAEIFLRESEVKRCMLCGLEVPDDTSLQIHIEEAHLDNLPPNTCHKCGKSYKDERGLQKHSSEHTNKKYFTCSICKKSFLDRNRLNRHFKTHRDKTVKCSKCDCVFPDGRSLSNHRHHHKVNPNKRFPCYICKKSFGTRSSQLIHIRLHTGEKPYGCTYCFKAFRDGGTLRKHVRIHTGEKPYKCAVCPSKFNQRVVLRDHIRTHHSGSNSKTGTYDCGVCMATFHSSTDIIQHLIQHSDDNTALSRKPPGYTGALRQSKTTKDS